MPPVSLFEASRTPASDCIARSWHSRNSWAPIICQIHAPIRVERIYTFSISRAGNWDILSNHKKHSSPNHFALKWGRFERVEKVHSTIKPIPLSQVILKVDKSIVLSVQLQFFKWLQYFNDFAVPRIWTRYIRLLWCLPLHQQHQYEHKIHRFAINIQTIVFTVYQHICISIRYHTPCRGLLMCVPSCTSHGLHPSQRRTTPMSKQARQLRLGYPITNPLTEGLVWL